jgi:cytochrome P450
MFAINTDLTHSQHELTELRRQIYEPFVRAQLKDMRADVKRTAEKLAKAHPDSDSIKRSFRIAFV